MTEFYVMGNEELTDDGPIVSTAEIAGPLDVMLEGARSEGLTVELVQDAEAEADVELWIYRLVPHVRLRDVI